MSKRKAVNPLSSLMHGDIHDLPSGMFKTTVQFNLFAAQPGDKSIPTLNTRAIRFGYKFPEIMGIEEAKSKLLAGVAAKNVRSKLDELTLTYPKIHKIERQGINLEPRVFKISEVTGEKGKFQTDYEARATGVLIHDSRFRNNVQIKVDDMDTNDGSTVTLNDSLNPLSNLMYSSNPIWGQMDYMIASIPTHDSSVAFKDDDIKFNELSGSYFHMESLSNNNITPTGYQMLSDTLDITMITPPLEQYRTNRIEVFEITYSLQEIKYTDVKFFLEDMKDFIPEEVQWSYKDQAPVDGTSLETYKPKFAALASRGTVTTAGLVKLL